MKNLINIFTVILALGIFSSCEKEEFGAIEKEVISQQEIAGEQSSRKSTNQSFVNPGVKTLDLTGATLPSEHARGAHACRIKCGKLLFHSNRGARSDHDRRFSCVRESNDDFKGGDRFYYFKVENDRNPAPSRHEITISDLNDDLDLFVYALDARGRIGECKAASITVGRTDAEYINLEGLSEGYYLVVVDAWASGVTSDYTIELTCSTVEPVQATPCWDLNGNGVGDLNEDTNVDHIVDEKDCTARSIKSVTYQDNGVAPGELTGEFRQLGISTEWIETIKFGSTGEVETQTYREVQRTMWSVFLQNTNSNVRVEIEIYHGQITSKLDGNAFASYEVTGRNWHPGGPEVTAANLKKITVSDSAEGEVIGSYEQVSDELWRFYNKEGVLTAELEEVTRIDESVYLMDHASGRHFQISLRLRNVGVLIGGVQYDQVYYIRTMN